MGRKKCKCCCEKGCDVCLGENVADFELQAIIEGVEPHTPSFFDFSVCSPDDPLFGERVCCDKLHQTTPIIYGGIGGFISFCVPFGISADEYGNYTDDWFLIEEFPYGTCNGGQPCCWGQVISPISEHTGEPFFGSWWGLEFAFVKLYADEDSDPVLGAALSLYPLYPNINAVRGYQVLQISDSLKIDCSELSIVFDDFHTEGESSLWTICDLPASVTIERVE